MTATSDFYRLYLEQEAVGSSRGEWMSADELVRTDSQEAQASLDRAKRRLAIEFGFAHEVTVCHLQGQNPAEAIVEMAAAEPTLVVMTTHGRSGINRLVLGSVTDRVVRHANTPVLVVRKWDEPGFTGVEERVSRGEGIPRLFGRLWERGGAAGVTDSTSTQFVMARNAATPQSRRLDDVSSTDEIARASLRMTRGIAFAMTV